MTDAEETAFIRGYIEGFKDWENQRAIGQWELFTRIKRALERVKGK